MGPYVVDRYHLAPAKCHVCQNSPTPALMLDPDEDDPNRLLHIYICWKCVRDMARMLVKQPAFASIIDYEVPSKVDLAELRAKLAAAEDQLAAGAARVAAADELLARLTAVVAGPDNPPPSDPEPEPEWPDAAKAANPRAAATRKRAATNAGRAAS